METLNETLNSMPRIGDTAPDFEALTTKGRIRLSDYAKEKWLVMFSHP
ncbi:MAG: redoxin domain-containing protein, partial [Croceitalea sp.]|nr:redoxin domain-containing protein [Croceitalea sp.]